MKGETRENTRDLFEELDLHFARLTSLQKGIRDLILNLSSNNEISNRHFRNQIYFYDWGIFSVCQDYYLIIENWPILGQYWPNPGLMSFFYSLFCLPRLLFNHRKLANIGPVLAESRFNVFLLQSFLSAKIII